MSHTFDTIHRLCFQKRARRCFADSYFHGSSIRNIGFYHDSKTLGALSKLKNLKSFVELTENERRSLSFCITTFGLRVLQFVATEHEDVVNRAECLLTFQNVDGRRRVKIEWRFSSEVISRVRMDEINQMVQSLWEGQLDQMTFYDLQVRASLKRDCR